MAEDFNDLLMMFVGPKGPVEADCLVEVSPGDDLTRDFKQGHYFELQDFDFSVGLEDTDAKALAAKNAQQGKTPPTTHAAKSKKDAKGKDGDEEKTKANFSQWRYPDPTKSGAKYPLDLQPFSFTRSMDRASTTFFQNCCDAKVFKSATLVKRTIVGGTGGMKAFLRIEFKDVLIIGLDWDDGEVVKEQCKFITRGVKVYYKFQSAEGALSAVKPGFWSMNS